MYISKYQVFIQVVESGSLTGAARRLGYSQPGISHIINSMEQEMGFKLLIRSKDKMIPTENGKKVLYYCYQIVRNETELQETISSINGLMEGIIRVGAQNSMLLDFVPSIVYRFSKLYSKIEFHILEGSSQQLREQLPQGSIDLAFMVSDIPKGFAFLPLLHDYARVIMPEDHPFAEYDRISPVMLNGCDFIMPISGYDDVVNSVLNNKAFHPNIRHYAASDAAVYAMVANGMGLSIVSELQAGHPHDNLISRPLDGDYYRLLGIATKTVKHAAPAVKEFIRIAQKAASEWEESRADPSRQPVDTKIMEAPEEPEEEK
ncbi:MAG: LysR family transcriptional regulator [Eubacteriales bacterium]|nr:LysR family transcriptional regulator [Eubacteriales bacterium]